MTHPAARDDQRRALQAAFGRADLTLQDLWVAYFTLGGDAGEVEIEAYLHGLMPMPDDQHDILAIAVNERLDDLTTRLRVPYSRTLREPPLTTGPLAALVGLLDGMKQAPPEHLVDRVAAAAEALGVDATLYVIDYDQHNLIPLLPDPNGSGRLLVGERLGVESTMAGQAFQRGRVVTSLSENRPRSWIPVLDGVERLGVLEIIATDELELTDPELQRDCWWVAGLIGHLITVLGSCGDALDVVRRSGRRTASAELVWNLLPPLTSGTDRFMVAGQFEPCYRVGGDAFDYALSHDTAWLAIFDATGHSLDSGLVTTAALAAYRAARRGGASLVEQAIAIDDVVTTYFAGRGLYVSGVLAEVDLTTGLMRYIVAGHPPPVLLRRGQVVKTLAGDGHGLFGLVDDGRADHQETLQPGDSLLLYTDGVTEARDRDGHFFGAARLEDFLRRAASAGYPPPETVRRLTRAVMDHQDGLLQDDATVLLASWTPTPHPTSIAVPRHWWLPDRPL